MPKIETDKVRELHSIAMTLGDILEELKRFNVNFEKTTSPYSTLKITSTDGSEILFGEEGMRMENADVMNDANRMFV